MWTGVDFDDEKIKARYLGFDVEKPRMFLDVYEQHNKEFEALVGKGRIELHRQQVRWPSRDLAIRQATGHEQSKNEQLP